MALDNGWVRIETTSGSGNMAVSAMVLERNTGRSDRSVQLVGENAHGVTATAIVKQDHAAPFIVIDHVESDNTPVTELDVAYGSYLIVGYSNVESLSVAETSEDYTDLNDMTQGEALTEGFDIVEHGNTHNHVQLESSIQYGTDEQYMFMIPMNVSAGGKTSRTVSVIIEDGDGNASATLNIVQKGELDY